MTYEEYEKIERERIERNIAYIENGVKFVDLKMAYIDEGVKIGRGTVIYPCVVLEGDVTIGEDCVIGQNSKIVDSKIGDECKVGDFVEVKNSSMGDGAKASHLTYIGDSDVGCNVNLGCGVVFVNYDGSKKYRSVVEDGAFVGCNSNLVSPVHVGKGAYIAAGSTITEDVPDGALYVARSRGTVREGWVEKKGILKKDKK